MTTAVATSARHVTTVIGEDTHVLVLLCHHVDTQSQDVYHRSAGRRNAKPRVWDIHWLQRTLGPQACRLLPFAHAIAGCDTTSRLFGIGKGVALQKLNSAPIFKQMAEVVCGKEYRKTLHLPVRRCSAACTGDSLARAWSLCVTDGSTRTEHRDRPGHRISVRYSLCVTDDSMKRYRKATQQCNTQSAFQDCLRHTDIVLRLCQDLGLVVNK